MKAGVKEKVCTGHSQGCRRLQSNLRAWLQHESDVTASEAASGHPACWEGAYDPGGGSIATEVQSRFPPEFVNRARVRVRGPPPHARRAHCGPCIAPATRRGAGAPLWDPEDSQRSVLALSRHRGLAGPGPHKSIV